MGTASDEPLTRSVWNHTHGLTSQIWSARSGVSKQLLAIYDSVNDERLGTDPGRLANRAEMIKIIEDWLAIEETVHHLLRARRTMRKTILRVFWWLK